MRVKTTIKAIIVSMLILCMSAGLFGSKKAEEEVGDLPNQYYNWSHYFQQGYLDTWDIRSDANTKLPLVRDGGDKKGGLIMQLFPKATETADNSEKAIYSVYSIEHGSFTLTQEEIAQYVVDPENQFYFNTRFLGKDNIERTNYRGDETAKKAFVNRIPCHSVHYTFVNGTEDWKGVFYTFFTSHNMLIVISFEAHVDVYDEYVNDFNQQLSDFRKLGNEK